MYYGSQGAWHDHHDRLNIEVIARGTSYLPEMGYPALWNDKGYQWTMGTTSHYTVLIDEYGHQGKPQGSLHLLADGAWARVMEASAERVYPGRASLYRRTVAMVDIDPNDSYLIDIFRVAGGRQHDYSFHGLPRANVIIDGVELGPAQPATVAGTDAPFGHQPKTNYHGSGYYYLEDPRYAKPTKAWTATWTDRHDPNRPRGLRLHVSDGACQEIVLAQAEPEIDAGNPKRMDWLLLRNRSAGAEPASSTYLGIIEPYADRSFITQVDRLNACDAALARKAGWAGLRIRHRAGTDIVCSSLDETVRVETAEGLVFQGRFGVIRKANDGTCRAFLANAALMALDAHVCVRGSGPARARIVRVLHLENAIEVAPALPEPDQFIGRVAIVQRGEHRTSYTVRSAATAGDRTRLGFGDVTCIIGVLEVSSAGFSGSATSTPTAGNQFTTRTRLSGYGIKFEAVRIPGLSAVSEDFKTVAPIVAQSGATFTLGDGVSATAFTDANRDGCRMVYLADLSVGEEVTLPNTVDACPNWRRFR
jgi:hypothetical protein